MHLAGQMKAFRRHVDAGLSLGQLTGRLGVKQETLHGRFRFGRHAISERAETHPGFLSSYRAIP